MPPAQPAPRVVIGIDGGSTKTRIQVRCADTDACLADHTYAGSTNLYMHPPGSGALQIARDLDQALAACLPDTSTAPLACVIGTAGIDAPGDTQRHLDAFLGASALRHLGERLQVLSDVETIAACGDQPLRVCAIAGTGSNTLALRYAQGEEIARHQIGGMDLLLSDEGSAARIGHLAFRAALQDLQGVRPSALGPALLSWLGVPQERGDDAWRHLRTLRMDLPKARLAEVTEAVVLPLMSTDPVARDLFHRAAHEIADQILAAALGVLAQPEEALEVLTVGGVWRTPGVHDQVTAAVQASFPNATVTSVDPAYGACRLARALCP